MGIQKMLLWVVLALFPGLSRGARDDVLEKTVDTISLLTKLGEFLHKTLQSLLPNAKAGIIEASSVKKHFERVFQGINEFFESIEQNLSQHTQLILQGIEPDGSLRAWKIFGSLFQLVFLVVFAFADIVQMVNNLSPLYPSDIAKLPKVFQTLSFSLLASSVGVAIAAGFILGDMGGITHFGGWAALKGGFRRFVQGVLWFSLGSTLIIDAIVALSRVRTVPEIAQVLSPSISDSILVSAAIAANLVIVPMFLVTLLFWQGLVGFKVLYITVVTTIQLSVRISHLLFVGLTWMLTFGVAYVVDFILRMLLWVIVATVGVLGWTLIGTGKGSASLLRLLQSILNLIYQPLDWFMGWLRKKLFLEPE